MGKFTYEMPDDFVAQLEKLDNYDFIAKMMLDTVAPLLVDSLKHEIRRFDEYSQDGSLFNSITASKAKKNQYGHYVSVGPKKGSKNKRGVRNGEVLAYLEYGTSKMTAKPVIAIANNAVENRVKALLLEIFNEEVGAK